MSPVNDRVTVVSHPLIGRSLAVLRDHATACTSFRVYPRFVARLMTFRVTQDLAVNEVTVTTPLQDTQSHQLRWRWCRSYERVWAWLMACKI